MSRRANRDEQPIRALIATNIPAPYRIPVYERLDDGRMVDLRALYFAERESNRQWVVPPTRVRSVTLRPMIVRWRGRYIHFTRGVWAAIAAARPDVVVTTGFNPAHLTAILYCVVHRVPHVVQTDGTVRSEAVLSRAHQVVRRAVTRRSASFVAASEGGLTLLRSWGAPAERSHLSPLATDNARFRASADQVRDVDVLFVGQFSEVKNPLFAVRVARAAAQRTGVRLRVVLIGSGPLAEQVSRAAEDVRDDLEISVLGFQQQDALAAWYRRARVFVFPTAWDPWGLVANEAAAAGVPVIVTPDAGCEGELIRDGVDGYVVTLDLEAWVSRLVRLLDDQELWNRFSTAALEAVQAYTFDAAASGLRAAIRQAAASRDRVSASGGGSG